jgi:8-oxo-dGTP diphosphatase
MPASGAVDVAVCVVRDAGGRVLLAERTGRQRSAGFWELPGGKIDAGETPQQAAARELEEETGIHARSLAPWMTYEHAFATRRVRIHFFRVHDWWGTPLGREGQRLVWVDPSAPGVAPILASNERAMRGLALPPLWAQTHSAPGEAQVAHALDALRAGARAIVVRASQGTPDQRVAGASRISALARSFGAHVVLEGTALEARRAGASGIYTGSRNLGRISSRPPVPVWIASCHDAAGVARAAALGADAAIVSPICAGSSGLPVGWDGLRRIASSAVIPIYARGGIVPSQLKVAQQAGAMGIVLDEDDDGRL